MDKIDCPLHQTLEILNWVLVIKKKKTYPLIYPLDKIDYPFHHKLEILKWSLEILINFYFIHLDIQLKNVIIHILYSDD